MCDAERAIRRTGRLETSGPMSRLCSAVGQWEGRGSRGAGRSASVRGYCAHPTRGFLFCLGGRWACGLALFGVVMAWLCVRRVGGSLLSIAAERDIPRRSLLPAPSSDSNRANAGSILSVMRKHMFFPHLQTQMEVDFELSEPRSARRAGIKSPTACKLQNIRAKRCVSHRPGYPIDLMGKKHGQTL